MHNSNKSIPEKQLQKILVQPRAQPCSLLSEAKKKRKEFFFLFIKIGIRAFLYI